MQRSLSKRKEDKRIVKNTIFLYIRTVFLIILSFYATRLLLSELGFTDFGIYSIIGGVVSLFTFVNLSMATSIRRYLNVSMSGDIVETQNVFITSLYIQIIIATFVVILAECIGLYLINNILDIPPERIFATNIAYQFIVFSTFLSIIGTSFVSLILAREDFGFYSVSSLILPFFKILFLVFLSFSLFHEKLILYAFAIFAITLITQLVNFIYCVIKYDDVNFKRSLDKSIFKNILSFSGWNFFGSVAIVSKDNGLNMIMNTFMGVIVNTASGIAFQISSGLEPFSFNIRSAFAPQITKSYARKEYDRFLKLIFLATKYAYFLLWIFALPLSLTVEYSLKLWLGEFPSITSDFVYIIIICLLIDSLSGSFTDGILAVGKIIRYQVIVSILFLISLPIAYILLYLGYSVIFAFSIKILSSILCFIWRIYYLRSQQYFSVKKYLKEVLRPIFITSILSLGCSYFLFGGLSINSFIEYIGIIVTTVIIVILSVFFFGLDVQEKYLIKNGFLRIKTRLGI